MGKRIVLMTANVQGGIIQFTFQLYHTLKDMGFDVKVSIPVQMHASNIEEIALADRLQYDKKKSIFSRKPYVRIARQIETVSPDYIWYCDDSVICSNVGLCIQNKGVQQLLTMHDAGGYHPTHNISIKDKVQRKYVQMVNKAFYKRVHRFVLLSPESRKTFCARFSAYRERVAHMILGAHIPTGAEQQPGEWSKGAQEPYLLFFGRIDKYKGINNLLRAYAPVADTALPLIIAGGGQLSEEEKELLGNTGNVTLINRYISDGEMKWLFSNATAVVLPYIEATQSGVIPIAYAYGKPVITTDIPGLTQFVRNGETGVVVDDNAALKEAIAMMTEEKAEAMRSAVEQYYRQCMDWQYNVERMFSQL